MREKFRILTAYIAKRWTLKRLRTGEDVRRRQQRLLSQLMVHATQNFAFYKSQKGIPFSQWPIVNKIIMLQEFGGMNYHGISNEQAWALAEDSLKQHNSSAQLNGLTIGTSTGTSGQRGLFLISADERAWWLGSILARCVPDFPFAKHRVAVLLATGNQLYDTAIASHRLAFQFFDLKQGAEIHSGALQKFAPDILIGSPKALAALARAKITLKPRLIFTGGEVLEKLEADAIADWFRTRPRSLYQATEGFLGVACAHGNIHLNEDDMLIEQEPVAGHQNHFVPIITDLRRRAQAMIRYRLNDVLVKLETPCPCGSPFLALARVEGRCDDMVHIGERTFMPDALRAVILDAERGIADFRLVQKADYNLELHLPEATPAPSVEKVVSALQNYLESPNAKLDIKVRLGIQDEPARKLRRIISETQHK